MANYGWMGRLLCGLLLLGAGLPGSANETSLYMSSDPGDYIGAGQEYFYTAGDGTFAATRNSRNGVSIFFESLDHWWQLRFAAPFSQPLAVGVYPGATSFDIPNPSKPGLDVGGDGRGCTSLGAFEVEAIEYGPGDTITTFRATLELRCGGTGSPALRAEILYNVFLPVRITAPRTTTVLEGEELTFAVTAVADNGGSVALTTPALPAGATFVDHGDNTGEFRWTPNHDQVGSHVVNFNGEDDESRSENVSTIVHVGGILRVPSDYPSIQSAIDAATTGGQVLVAPGTYVENIDYEGKNITVMSESGPGVTFIEKQEQSVGTTVLFSSGEGIAAVLRGFTIRGGLESFGSAVWLYGSSATIVDNIFEGNVEEEQGFGAAIRAQGSVHESSSVIERNVFRHNICLGNHLSGVVVLVGDATPRIVNNLFVDNPWCPAINILTANAGTVIHNTLVGNQTAIRLGDNVPTIHQVYANNIIYANEVGLERGLGPAANAPTWTHNLVFGNTTDYLGIEDRTGVDGNISADPLFACMASGNFRPTADSPAIDAGDPVELGFPETDLDGRPRAIDGDGDSTALVDIGAFEFDPAAPPGEPEVCDGLDNDCDGLVDEGPSGVDADGDSVAGLCDNCPLFFNATQSDFDHDGQGDACDLDDGEIWQWRDDGTSVSWQAEQGTTEWNVYTGDLAVLRSTGVYTQAPGSNALANRQCHLASTVAPDTNDPAPGSTSFTLITGVTAGVEGPLGSGSIGVRANTNPCP